MESGPVRRTPTGLCGGEKSIEFSPPKQSGQRWQRYSLGLTSGTSRAREARFKKKTYTTIINKRPEELSWLLSANNKLEQN